MFKLGDYAVNEDGIVFHLQEEHQVFILNAIGTFDRRKPRHATPEEIEAYHWEEYE